MPPNLNWIFVDDVVDEQNAYAQNLSRGQDDLRVIGLSPKDAREQILTGANHPDGVLMDVELTSAAGELGTGPGIAQDIRVKQKAGEIEEFPVVRFAGRQPVVKNIKGDPASDDLFDLKISKESLTGDRHGIVSRIRALSEIYNRIRDTRANRLTEASVHALLGVNTESWQQWGHARLCDRLLSGMQASIHVAAGDLLRSFLIPTGLLVDENVLAIRMGLDLTQSGKAWVTLRESLDFKYAGVGASAFPRWWAAGFDNWWARQISPAAPVASLSTEQRFEALSKKRDVNGLVRLKMPTGSPGSKPWRTCVLSSEESPPSVIAVDPTEGVRVLGMTDTPPWVDPLYAALGPALRSRDDHRLNRVDLARLSAKYNAR
jgi:hypothetical protein